MADYELRTFSLPVGLEERFTAELWSLGALGFESHEAAAGQLRLDAYFPVPLPAALRRFAAASWQRRGICQLSAERFAEQDWLADYRRAVEPLDVGQGFRIDPRDQVEAQAASPSTGSRRTLRIPARTAFGTGSHESTRLALEWIEATDLTGCAVLDVGTGSGILSFVAEVLGARRVVGFDIDAQAVCQARVNARLNGLAPKLFAGGFSAIGAKPRFDLALVNVLPENLCHEIPRLVAVLQPRARVISSGNLLHRRDELLGVWADWGLTPLGEKRENEWVAWLLQGGSS